MNWTLFFSIGIPSSIAIMGWFFAHLLTAKRERQARRREARVKALEASFLRISLAVNRQLNEKSMDDIERFVSEIQLYGTPKQVEMMNKIVEEFKRPNFVVSWDDLVSSLRDELRKELRLEPIKGPVWWFVFYRGKGGQTDTEVRQTATATTTTPNPRL